MLGSVVQVHLSPPTEFLHHQLKSTYHLIGAFCFADHLFAELALLIDKAALVTAHLRRAQAFSHLSRP